MKTKLLLSALAALTIGILGSCSKINERIDDIDSRVDSIEQEKIASIGQQIATINSSIADLGTIRNDILNLQAELGAKGKDISELKAADEAIGKRIDDLKAYVGDLSKYAEKDWATATFATLEQLETTEKALESLKETVDKLGDIDGTLKNLKAELSDSIASAISSLAGRVNKLEEAVDELKGRVDALEHRIQSVTIIPAYNDGSVKNDNGTLTINCIISPASAVSGLTKSSFKLLLNEVRTKAAAYETLNISTYTVTDAASGEVEITADISDYTTLGDGKALTAALRVKDFTTDFVGVFGGITSNQTIPASHSGDFTLESSDKVILTIEGGNNNNITLKYAPGSQLPKKLVMLVENGSTYGGTISGTLPYTTVEFIDGSISTADFTTAQNTFAVIYPAKIETKLVVEGGNVLIKGAVVAAIEVAANAFANPVTKAPVQIVVEKYTPEPTEEDPTPEKKTPVVTNGITASANVIVAPASDVTVKVEPAANVQVAKEGAGTVKNGEQEITTKAAAQIGTAKYITLADAIAAVKNNEQIDIIAEEISATEIPEGNKTFTIDLGNNEVTVVGPAVGSSQTMNQAFQILKGNTVTIQNGTIKCDNTNDIFRFVIQNYSDLTLDNVTVDGTNLKKNDRTDAYTVSSNFGTITFAGNTTVKASTVSGVDAYAIDLYDYTKNGYTEPATGVWKSEGSIIGAITLGGGSLTVSKELKLTKPMKAYKGDNGKVNLTVNANIIPGDNFDGDALVIVNRGGDLTISGSGKVSNNNNAGIYCAVKMTEAADVDSDSETNRAKLTVNGHVTLEGYQAGISGNGNSGRGHTDVTINGSVLVKGCATNEDECCGIYQPQNGTLTINGGTIEGLVGVYVKSGSVTTAVNGGTIKGTGAKNDYVANGGGFKETGDAIVFDNCDYPGGAPNATIDGGTFISTNGQAVASYAKTGLNPISPVINGGTFSDLYGIVYAASGATYKLGNDVAKARGIKIPAGKNFIVDFQNHKYAVECPGAGSPATQTQGFQINSTPSAKSTITFKNGTIECTQANKNATWQSDSPSKGIAMLIQDYADLTLENMTIDGTNIAHNGNNARYILSSNYGNITIKGSTSIIAPAGDFAFDVYDNKAVEGEDNSYPGAPTVTVNTTGTINGQVEVTGGNLIIYGGTFTNSKTAIWAKSGNVTVNNGSITSTSNCAIGVTGTTTAAPTVTLINGTFNSQESTVLFDGVGATVSIEGGTYKATDNAVISGNGTDRSGNANNVTISGGTFNGGITTSGYIACGIYAPWKDNITVTGGTFNITKGSGVVVRGGKLTMSAATFKYDGDTSASGWVGDNKNALPCGKDVVVDKKAAYPNVSKIQVTASGYTVETIE